MILKLLTAFLVLSLFVSPALQLPAKKPNIIVILADDMGYSDIGSFGSEIKTPHLDEMAKNGLRMAQFYNASRCCPTRASLLTGLFQHQAGVGDMVNCRKQPAYQGYLNQNCVTIAEALKQSGYKTYMAGKWHVGTKPEYWPIKRGFDRYFGLIDGASSYFGNEPYRPNQKLTIALDDQEYKPEKGYYMTNAFADHAVEFVEQHPKDQPFFLYVAFTSPHWPLHALPEDIAKYRGTYAKGWDKLREERYRRMQESGILTKNTKLSPRDPKIPSWETLSAEEKKSWEDNMAVYAAMIDRMDQNIGRIQQKLKETGQDHNTVILFLSDNGASHEDIKPTNFLPAIYESSKKPSSDPSSFTAYGMRGANLSNTPFRQYKHWEYEGGTATPFIAFGPSIVKPGRIDQRPGHIIDIMATCLDLAGGTYPKTYKGNAVTPTEGVSLVPLFRGTTWKGHDALFFEHEGHRAVRQGDWKLVSEFPENRWELYNLKTDRSELQDVSAKEPERVKQLAALYDAWAQRAGVIPFAELGKSKGE
ncbi:arylsulfatase [Larkinella terrae]|uniref:Sulfatase-like hydrolase/transferase n=1 Tax=Larkinella terrae TaxID=2025311 RepID=A0A7K0EUV6_9BACT|nr:arylsulfatase [Larkinella terrae]MRS65590.1 sulfatase-like hydrolase/transferase [Larkinella terrae]